MSAKIKEIKPNEYSCNGKLLSFARPLIMAIVNVTPDSFYDGGKYGTIDDILIDAGNKLDEGADILDIGGASSRPNATEITEKEEWDRIKLILPELKKRFPDALISIDTYRSGIAEKSAESGADIINDISGGNMDNRMFETVARLNLPYILMHLNGTPQTMQNNDPYVDVVSTVKNELSLKIETLHKLGFKKIIIDPGFGFGKSLHNNYQLLKGITELKSLGYPLLSGISRKSMINKVIVTNPVTALNGTTVLNTIALLNGSDILRVHDVREAKQAVELVNIYKNC
jgi:dihydropteroate synthase